MDKKKQYVSIKELVEMYPFTNGQIRNWMLFRNKNGMNEAVYKIGKRVYIRTDLFDEWLEKHNCGGDK